MYVCVCVCVCACVCVCVGVYVCREKIADIRRELDNESGPITTYVSLASPVLSRLDKFDKVSVDYISKLVMKAPSKSCVLDAIPTPLLKDCLSVLAPFLTELVNQSLEQGQFPSLFKLAAITPLLKKPELDSSFNNYRPISNLTFLSKLIERVVSNQLVRYLLGPLCYKLITIVNWYLEAGLTCFVYCPKALYLIIFIVWHPF